LRSQERWKGKLRASPSLRENLAVKAGFLDIYIKFEGKYTPDMTKVLPSLGKSKRRPIEPGCGSRSGGKDPVDLELCAAKEILAEVFGITLPEVDEMIKQRSEERMIWPERFWLDEPKAA